MILLKMFTKGAILPKHLPHRHPLVYPPDCFSKEWSDR